MKFDDFLLKKRVVEQLKTVPGVGKTIALDLYNLGIRSINDLKNKDPEKLYDQLCQLQNQHVDRCMLYVFRCAIYYASHEIHDPHLLKWWSWKDEK